MTEAFLRDVPAPASGEFDEWSSSNIAPMVIWLASDDAASVTGQVFVVHGGQVCLLQAWTVVSEIDHRRKWTVQEITRRADELFADRDRGLPKWG